MSQGNSARNLRLGDFRSQELTGPTSRAAMSGAPTSHGRTYGAPASKVHDLAWRQVAEP